MDWTVIITSIIGMISAISVAFITRGIKKSNAASNETTQSKLDNIEKRLQDQELANQIRQAELSQIKEELADNNLRTMRLDLDRAIDTDPDNIIVIMDMAQKYFVEMHGNCYMSKKFQDWANEHKVNITGLFNKD